MAKFVLCIALMPLLAAAAAQINYPLDQQLPTVARVGSPFIYQFAPTTFSGSQILHYALVGNPSWLSLDDESRTLTGTPRSSDAGFANFNITATGDNGSVASMESKLYISTDSGPVAKADISEPLSAAGQLTGPRTVTLKPSKQFTIDFPSDSFNSKGIRLSYYAMLSDHTPLPAWIHFDAPSMRFTGTTMMTTTPQSLEILLIASSTPGFADSSLSFTIAISQHTFGFEPFGQTINVASGQKISIVNLKSKLLLDGSSVSDSKIQSALADIPSWLTFDNETFAISGEAPADITSQDLVITAQDQFGDSAEYTIHLVFESEFFASNLEDLNATLGEHFSYVVPRTIFAKGDGSVTIDFSALSDNLSFDPATSTISGTIPSDFTPQNVECLITATSADGSSHDTQAFHINVSKATTSSQSGTVSSSDTPHGSTKRNRGGVIAGSVIGSICAAALLVALAICLCRKRRNSSSYINRKQPRSPRKSDISRPMFIPYGWPDNDMDLHADDDLEKGKDAHDSDMQRTPEQPPKLDLNLNANRNRRDSHSATDSIGDISTRILDIFEESPFGIHNDITPSQHPHDSMKIPTELAKRGSQRSDDFRKHKRRTTTVYHDQIHRSTGLPVNRRITGMGHGRHTYSPSGSNTNFSSIRRPMSSSSYTTRCTSVFSTTPSAFPRSPAARKHKTFVTIPTEARRSIRVVPSSRRSSILDRRTIDEKRSSYIRKRASAQSPFFSAGFRASSSTYTSPPAFTNEARSPSRNALSPLSRNAIVRPDDSVIEGREKEVPDEVETIPDVPDLVESPSQEFPGSLRKYRTNRPHTAISPPRNRVEKSYNRPGTAISTTFGSFRRRASTRHSLRAYDLKASLNDLTGSKVFEDAEMSDSVYSAEERDIEEAEQRKTVIQSQYTLPPLNLDRVDTKRNSKRNSKAEKKSKRDSKRELKRTSERDPTPYFYLAPGHEHGGKENASSSYNLGHRSTPVRSEAKGKAKVLPSPERPKTMTTGTSRTAEARKSNRASQKTVIRQDSTKERHSRKSIHSRTQSRHSGGTAAYMKKDVKKTRSHSRSQSSAYPFFDTATLDTTPCTKPRSSFITNNPLTPAPTTTTTATTALPVTTSTTPNNNDNNNTPDNKKTDNTKPTLITRDLSGNLTFYGADEEPTIEHLDSSSIAFRSRNGTISPTARQSRLASLHLSSQPPPTPPPKSARRRTVGQGSSVSSRTSGGLGFFPPQTPGDERRGGVREKEKASLDGKGEREQSEGVEEPGRKTWGSIRTVLGRSGRWVSGGYWEGRGKEEKVFI
ncbi:hypothetical protein T440DRAFT_402148 [Plenodomus tracheiphilus IPT5]|uniref:Dystroglycan-type cadherin-like domain-containing protein n=1 Tax=Plenodomus tracheiphilus IPT5 TaxID=1408161 RepID=A0A6A7AYS4_9PLEO|nr:hypothetical protein T440DRAFT_402148 [Plenodomus tracheiphilus IPT5]